MSQTGQLESGGVASGVCVVGSVNLDLTIRVDRLPAPGETVIGGGFSSGPGGKGANQAVAAARQGASVSLVASIGDDEHAKKLREQLEGDRVDLTNLLTRTGTRTGVAMIAVDGAGENMIFVSPGANAQLSADDVRVAGRAISRADVLLVQLEISPEVVQTAAEIAKAAGKAVILNAAPARRLPPGLLKLVDVLVVNRTEGSLLLGLDPGQDPARLALRLPELGPPTMLLTLGAQGAILCHRGRPRRVPALRVQSIDTVGAGDAFVGALAARWAPVHASRHNLPDELRHVQDAVAAAAIAGALATTKRGAISAMPTREEVAARADQIKMVI